jgi:cytochrome o ubiquinol oxidase operon protein cyoD
MDGSHAYPAGNANHDAGHASVRNYVTGFVLSVILTGLPFGLVMSGALAASTAVPICVALGLMQIVVHLVYFLHMNGSSSRTWNGAAFVFTVVILAILVVGSLWVMHHMDANMMPGMMQSD